MRYPTLVLALAIALGTACDRGPQAPPAPATTAPPASAATLTPAEVVASYYDALAHGRHADAYGHVTYADRNARSLEDFTTQQKRSFQEAIARHRRYVINDTAIEGDTARVEVDITAPDMARLQRIVIAELRSSGVEPTADIVKAKVLETLLRPDLPTIVTHQSVLLTREPSGGGWKLDFDWDGEHPQRGVPLQERLKKAAPDAGD